MARFVAEPRYFGIIRGSAKGVGSLAMFVARPTPEIEHVEQIAYRRTVHWEIGIVLMQVWVRKIIAAASGKRTETPIALDEL